MQELQPQRFDGRPPDALEDFLRSMLSHAPEVRTAPALPPHFRAPVGSQGYRPDLGSFSLDPKPPSLTSERTTHGWRGRFQSRKGGMAAWRSRLELRLIQLYETDPDVATFSVRSSILTYTVGARRRRYTPRLVVEKSNERWLVEVGWAQKVNAPSLRQRWLEVAAAANALGFGFEVLTEAQLDWQPRARNVIRLLRARRQLPIATERSRQVLAALPKAGLLISELMEELPDLGFKEVTALILQGTLAIDLCRPYQETVRVWPNAHAAAP